MRLVTQALLWLLAMAGWLLRIWGAAIWGMTGAKGITTTLSFVVCA